MLTQTIIALITLITILTIMLITKITITITIIITVIVPVWGNPSPTCSAQGQEVWTEEIDRMPVIMTMMATTLFCTVYEVYMDLSPGSSTGAMILLFPS